ncbi:MAG: insulinase family protein [Cyanobacteria bacterium]|nr:insulinase family protein [Cyanobacteriota bacterium]MDW8202183.1 pitrilysin family protein [Cyanobacteriota bacterium SKYGB_h_bin112]
MSSPPKLTTTRLANGLTIVHQEISATPVAVVDVWVRAGAVLEPDQWMGIAHFLEHMVFKGSDRIAPGEFDHAIESRGGTSNAATSHDYAHFYVMTAQDQIAATLPYLAELLTKAAIPEREFYPERQVVLEELRQAQDDPDWLGFQTLMETIYPHHPYRRSILGTPESLMGISSQDMQQFHQAHYQPHNMTVVITGGIDYCTALELVEHHFQEFPAVVSCPRPLLNPDLDFVTVQRQELVLPRLSQARLMMAWRCPGIDPNDPLLQQFRLGYGLDLLSALLTDGRCARLTQELREDRGLVDGISSNFSLQRYSSLFTITAWLPPKNLDRVEAIICDRLSTLQSCPPTMAELTRCQRLLCNDYAFSTESPAQLAGLYGFYSTIATADIALTYPDQVRSFTPEEIQHLAQVYLSPYHYASVILRPDDVES